MQPDKAPLSIFVTGAAGEIGHRLVRRLVGSGHSVRALVLPNDPLVERLAGMGCEIHYGDITQPATLQDAFRDIHTVYHLAAALLVEDEQLFRKVNVEGTLNMVEAAAAAGVTHFVHVSSASVVYPRSTPYSRSKRDGEAVVAAQPGLNYTIVRPTQVYEHSGGLEFKLLVDYLKRFPVVPLIGDGRALKNPVHADDLIDGLLALAGNPLTYGKLYNLCGGETVSVRELAELLLKHEGLRKPLVPVPLALCRLGAWVVGAALKKPRLMEHALAELTQDANLDLTTAARDLGYRPVGIREGLTRC